LYRVPGSGQQVKRWQRRFDEEYDVDLFEQDDLYDINIIGSMLKAWLRELPDELLPKAIQDRVSRECQGATEVPQMLVDELSNLPPFNYYLLFAITCHLSLLLAHQDKNKMSYPNLCICFQPCMKIDAFCFKFLVQDWRKCWKGCRNEARYIEEEYALFDEAPPRGITEPAPPPSPAHTKGGEQQLQQAQGGATKQQHHHHQQPPPRSPRHLQPQQAQQQPQPHGPQEHAHQRSPRSARPPPSPRTPHAAASAPDEPRLEPQHHHDAQPVSNGAGGGGGEGGGGPGQRL
jgi:hypothetical protein